MNIKFVVMNGYIKDQNNFYIRILFTILLHSAESDNLTRRLHTVNESRKL